MVNKKANRKAISGKRYEALTGNRKTGKKSVDTMELLKLRKKKKDAEKSKSKTKKREPSSNRLRGEIYVGKYRPTLDEAKKSRKIDVKRSTRLAEATIAGSKDLPEKKAIKRLTDILPPPMYKGALAKRQAEKKKKRVAPTDASLIADKKKKPMKKKKRVAPTAASLIADKKKKDTFKAPSVKLRSRTTPKFKMGKLGNTESKIKEAKGKMKLAPVPLTPSKKKRKPVTRLEKARARTNKLAQTLVEGQRIKRELRLKKRINKLK